MTTLRGLLVVGVVGGLLAGCGDDNASQTPVGPTIAQSPAETTPANRAPRASGSIPAQILTAGGDPTLIDVAPYFSDPDGDTLTYTATTSDPEAVQATVSGSIVTLTVLADREATVTVAATDPAGLTATQLVRYRAIWEALEPGSSGGDECTVGQVLNPGDFCTVDIPRVNVGTNRFEVRSDGQGCYGNICSPRNFNLNGFQASRQSGNSWRIDAVPGGGGTNSAPEAVGSIPAQTLTAGGTAGSVNAGRYFRDPDGDALTYTARSSRSGVVTASVSGSTVTLTPVAAGTATVTVTARDPGGLTATQSIAVTVQAGGPAVEGEITVCRGTRQQFSGLVDVDIEGTVRARRRVSFVRVTGEANGHFVGIDLLGSMSSGESKSFEISGFISTSASTLNCTAEVEWTEFSLDAPGGQSDGGIISVHAVGALH